MKIRMRTLLSGPSGSIQAGQVADLDDAQAQDLIAGGYAEAVADKPAKAEEPAADQVDGLTTAEIKTGKRTKKG